MTKKSARILIRRAQQTSIISLYQKLNPTHIVPKHHYLWADMLERLVKGELNEANSLALTAPPGSAKSTITNHMFAMWYLGYLKEIERKPGNVIMVTNTQDLAQRCGVFSRNIALSDGFNDIFPDIKLSYDYHSKREMHLISRRKSDMERWEYLCTGVGGAQSGRRAGLVITDDPYKNKKDTMSAVKRQEIENVFSAVLSTRLVGKKIKLLMHTRWSVDDLIGTKVLTNSNWDYIKLPVFAEDYEEYEIKNPIYQRQLKELYGRPYYFRDVGESIWPNHPTGDFSERKIAEIQQDIGDDDYHALYKGAPILPGGNLIKTDNFVVVDEVPETDYLVITCDTAWTKDVGNAYTVFQLWGKHRHGAVLLRQLRGRWTYDELRIRTKQFFYECQNDFGAVRSFAIEKEASGIALFAELSQDCFVPIEAIEVKGRSKVLRVREVLNHITLGRVWIYKGFGDLKELLDECKEFPATKYADQVDTLAHGLHMIFIKGVCPYDRDDFNSSVIGF